MKCKTYEDQKKIFNEKMLPVLRKDCNFNEYNRIVFDFHAKYGSIEDPKVFKLFVNKMLRQVEKLQ